MSRATKAHRRTLTLRLEALTLELTTCSTSAMTRRTQESIDDTRRQLRGGDFSSEWQGQLDGGSRKLTGADLAFLQVELDSFTVAS